MTIAAESPRHGEQPDIAQAKPRPSTMPDDSSQAGYVRRLTIAVAVGFVLFVVVAGFLAFAFQDLDTSRVNVARALTIQSQARNVLNIMRRAESAQRYYLLTGLPKPLADIDARLAEFPSQLDALDALVTRPDQQQRLDTVRMLAAQKAAELKETISLYQSGRQSEALDIVKTGHGDELMIGIRRNFDDFISTNIERVAANQQAAEANLRRTWTLAIVAAVALLLLAGLVAVMTRHQFVALVKTQTRLRDLNRDLEGRVLERTAEFEAARQSAEWERERAEALLRDVNHRVGNNLALVSSFLGLQMRNMRDDASKGALESARNRVHTIATTQRKLRLGAETDFTRIDTLLREVIEDVAASMAGAQRVRLDWEIQSLSVQSRDAVSVGVIVSELVVNALKYAFPNGASGRVVVRLRPVAEGAELEVEDDGAGKKDRDATEQPSGLGSQIIYLLCKQYGGEPSYRPASPGASRPGLVATVPLPQLKINTDGDNPT